MKSDRNDRWDSDVQVSGNDLTTFLQDHVAHRQGPTKACLVLGRGFDPRMLAGFDLLRGIVKSNEITVIMLAFDEGITSPSRRYDEFVKKNLEADTVLSDRTGCRSDGSICFLPKARRITSRSAEGVFRTAEELKEFTDIFVDVSSLPRSVYFPVIAKLLFLLDSMDGGAKPNLFVLVSESAALDAHITEEGIDEDADYIHPFRGAAERESAAGRPRVWFPLLGENQTVQLKRIYDLVNPAEICPLLPAPSVNPRRGDELVMEYRELLFDQLRVEARNFIYASETNAFEAYRQLRRAILHYGKALKPLGGSNAVISANSSKLLSVGALLAAYELKRSG